MFMPGDGQIRIVTIETYRHAIWTNCFCDTSGDCSRAATHIENGHPRSKELRQTPMVALECSAIENAPIGLVVLLSHSYDSGYQIRLRLQYQFADAFV
jgi:hypothetical protein